MAGVNSVVFGESFERAIRQRRNRDGVLVPVVVIDSMLIARW